MEEKAIINPVDFRNESPILVFPGGIFSGSQEAVYLYFSAHGIL